MLGIGIGISDSLSSGAGVPPLTLFWSDSFNYSTGALGGQDGWATVDLGTADVITVTASHSIVTVRAIDGAAGTTDCVRAGTLAGFNINQPWRVEIDAIPRTNSGDRADPGIVLGDLATTFLDMIFGHINGTINEVTIQGVSHLSLNLATLTLDVQHLMAFAFNGTTITLSADGIVIYTVTPTLPFVIGNNDFHVYMDYDSLSVGETGWEFNAVRLYQ